MLRPTNSGSSADPASPVRSSSSTRVKAKTFMQVLAEMNISPEEAMKYGFEEPVKKIVQAVVSSDEDEVVAKPGAQVAKTASVSKKFVQYLDRGCMKEVRQYEDGTIEQAVMGKGPGSTCEALFKDGTVTQSELPNLMLVILKRPASALAEHILKRPASRLNPVAVDEQPVKQRKTTAGAVVAGEAEKEVAEKQPGEEQEEEAEQETYTGEEEGGEEEETEVDAELIWEDELPAAKAALPRAAEAKAALTRPVRANAEEQLSYTELRAEYKGTDEQWKWSKQRMACIQRMTLSEVRKRRFEHYRPDLFMADGDGKWIKR